MSKTNKPTKRSTRRAELAALTTEDFKEHIRALNGPRPKIKRLGVRSPNWPMAKGGAK